MVSSSPPPPPPDRSTKKNRLRSLLGLGYWVQGFRCFPWMAINFFLKDGLNVDPSTLQLLQNSANLPMVGKPLYGVVSDAVYISGQHRIPYIAIGAFLQALSWLSIAFLSRSGISILSLSLFLLLSNLGASIAEVANDAIVAETGKQLTTSSETTAQASSSGELQSFVWMASAAGGVLGNLLCGIAIDRYSTRSMFFFFGLLVALQFFITIVVRERSLNLPKSASNIGIRNQLSELAAALRKPDLAYAVGWLAASYALSPALNGTMFFYQTQHLKMSSSVLGISKVFGQAAMLLWGVIYNSHFKLSSPRRLLSAIQITMAVFMMSDVLFVKGIYRGMGVPDSVYVVIFSGLLEVFLFFKILPFSVLIAQLCPPGCEGSVMAFVMSAIALSLMVSGYFGVVLASYTGVTGADFDGFPRTLLIQAVCTVLPLLCTSFIPDDMKSKATKTRRKEE